MAFLDGTEKCRNGRHISFPNLDLIRAVAKLMTSPPQHKAQWRSRILSSPLVLIYVCVFPVC